MPGSQRFVSPRKRPRDTGNGPPSHQGASGPDRFRRSREDAPAAVSHLSVSVSDLLARKRPPTLEHAAPTASPGPAAGARRAPHPNLSVECLSWEEAARASLGPPGDEVLRVDDPRAVLTWSSARARLLGDGARGSLCTEAWIRHHFRCALWRLAHQERMEARWRGKRLRLDVLYAQLQYHYRRELEMGKRCALSAVMARDQTAKRMMTLVVVGVPSARQPDPGAGEGGAGAGAQELLLADGWYAVRASLDRDLSAVVRAGRVGVGDKLHVFGAALAGAPSGCMPLECDANNAAGASSVGGAPVLTGDQEPRLCLSYNSVRAAPLSCKLGFQSVRCPRVCVSSLRPGGGVVPCIEVVVTRVTSLLFMERLAPGSVLVRTEAEEAKAQEGAERAAAQEAGEAVVKRLEQWNHPAAPRARRALHSRRAGQGSGVEHVLSLLEEGQLSEDQGEEIHRLVQQTRRAERDVAPFVAVQAVCLSPPRELLHAMGITAPGAGAAAARADACAIEGPRTLYLGPSPPASAASASTRSHPCAGNRGSGAGSSAPSVDSLIARSVESRACELTMWKVGPSEAARLKPGAMLRVYLASASTRGAHPPMFARQQHGEGARPLLRLSVGRNARWSEIGGADDADEGADGDVERNLASAEAAAALQRGGTSADRVAWIRRVRQRVARVALSQCTPPPIARLHTLRPGLAVDVPGIVLRIVGPLAPEHRRGRSQATFHVFLADESCRVLVVTAPGDSVGPFVGGGSGTQHAAEGDAPSEPKVAALHREESRGVFGPRLPAGVVCTAVGIAAANRDPGVGVERCQWTDFSAIVRASDEPTAAVQRKVHGLIGWAQSHDGVRALEAMSRQLEVTLDHGPAGAASGEAATAATTPPDSMLSGQLVASGNRLSVSVVAGESEDQLRVAASFAGLAPGANPSSPQDAPSPPDDLAGLIAGMAGPRVAAHVLQGSSPTESLGGALALALRVKAADGALGARTVWPLPHVESLLRFVAPSDAEAAVSLLQPLSGSWDAHTLAALAVEVLVLRAIAQRVPPSDGGSVCGPRATLPTLLTGRPVLLWRCFLQCGLLLRDTRSLDDHEPKTESPSPAEGGALLQSVLGAGLVQGVASHTIQAAVTSACALLGQLERVARERGIPAIPVEVPLAMGRPSYQVPVLLPMTCEGRALHERILARRLDALAVSVRNTRPTFPPVNVVVLLTASRTLPPGAHRPGCRYCQRDCSYGVGVRPRSHDGCLGLAGVVLSPIVAAATPSTSFLCVRVSLCHVYDYFSRY